MAAMKPALLLPFLLAFTAQAFEFTGKVVGVTDGDTITVLFEGKKQYKVRLQHIDCPETRQPFATKAKQSLSSKVFGKGVTVKWNYACKTIWAARHERRLAANIFLPHLGRVPKSSRPRSLAESQRQSCAGWWPGR